MVAAARYVHTPNGLSPAAPIGGKAANLERLGGAGLAVPHWLAVTTDALQSALAASALDARVAARLAEAGDGPDALRAASDEIRSWILALAVPDEVAAAIERACGTAFPVDALLAVRSSAVGEDAAGESFAGLHDSFLFVARHGILEAVKGVWASAWNERALSYRRELGLPLDCIAVGVIVQEMVDARASGVAFTANPVTGNVHEIVVNSVFGAGEGLVSGGLDADTFIVWKQDLSTRSEIAEKEEELVLDRDAGSGLTRRPLQGARRLEPSLTDEHVRKVARTAIEIERLYGRPQDIEFSVDRTGRVLILQARPVTTVDEYGPAAGDRIIWDNSNIIESYSGVTTPLTFSVIREAYTIVYHCFVEVMGIPPRVVRENREILENMLGLIRGRVYYNILNWYRLLALFPGFRYNKSFMESMMGLKEPIDFGDETPGFWRRHFVELPRLVRLLALSAGRFARIRGLVGRFQSEFDAHMARWRAVDLERLTPRKLFDLYREAADTLLWNWKAPIINDFYVMVCYGVLRQLCAAWCGDEKESLQNDLLCGEGDIESTKPTKMLLQLAAMVRGDPELLKLVLERPPEELAETIPNDERFEAFATELGRYLELYGFRCMNELKLEEYSLRDRPAFVYQMIRNYVALDDPGAVSIEAMEARERETRRRAESRAFGAIRAGRGSAVRLPVFRWVLRNARLGVKNRENMRFARSRIYDLLRDIFRQTGRRLAEEGILDEHDDVFYLTTGELADFIKGTAVTADLRALAALRRREFDRYHEESEREPDDHFETFGMVYHRNRFRDARREGETASEGGLRGTGCCPGEVEGPVKVIRSPSDDMCLSGEILVAGRTDPGWVPLYPSASGVLIERGSILSHSAIVAREMGIPTIVGIPGLLGTVETGQRVRMDGSLGTVEIVGAKPGAGAPPTGDGTPGDREAPAPGAPQEGGGASDGPTPDATEE